MRLNEYSEAVEKTIQYPRDKMGKCMYPALGLTGEAGEVADKIKKVYRDNNGVFTEEIRTGIVKELGDVLWYVNAMAVELDVTLEEVAQTNIDKLTKRMEKGVLGGSGDNREDVPIVTKPVKYFGTYNNIQHLFSGMGINWSTLKGSTNVKHRFKPTIGGCITWFMPSGTVLIQGPEHIRKRLHKNVCEVLK